MSIFDLRGLQSLNLRIDEIDAHLSKKHKERDNYKSKKIDYTFDQILQNAINKEEKDNTNKLTLQGLNNPANDLRYSMALEKFYNNL